MLCFYLFMFFYICLFIKLLFFLKKFSLTSPEYIIGMNIYYKNMKESTLNKYCLTFLFNIYIYIYIKIMYMKIRSENIFFFFKVIG
jgi:hypothetical protein